MKLCPTVGAITRSRLLLMALGGALLASVAAAGSAPGASSSTVVGATVTSATSLDVSGCAAGTANVSELGNVMPGSTTVSSSDCAVLFGSSNDTASLRVAQQDARGSAMWQYSRGALDASFDGPSGTGDGRFLLPIGSANDFAPSSVLQGDGKLVLTGYCSNGANDDFCAVRLNADGSWDTTFDGPSGTGDGRFLLPIGASQDWAQTSALQSDGKLVLAGQCSNGTNDDFCAARINPDGSWDTTFDGPSGTGDGRFLLPIGAGNDRAYSSVLQGDGTILLAGICSNGTNDDFCAARLNPDGSWDTTFDGPSGTGDGRFLLTVGAGADWLRSSVLQGDGKLVLSGQCFDGAGYDFCVGRLNSTGSWDITFDGPSGTGDGRFLLPIGTGNDNPNASALQSDGKLMLAGDCTGSANLDFCFARLNADGTWDIDFDGPSGTGNGRFLLPIGPSSDYVQTIMLQADTKPAFAGACHNGTDFDFCAARLNGNGSYDTTFDGPSGTGDGRFLIAGATGDRAFSSALAADGRMLLAGACHNGTNDDFCAASLDTGGRLEDYLSGSRDWSVGTSMFGACLNSVASGASAAWTLNAGCGQINGTSWNAIPATPSVIARTTVAGTLGARANLRFGMRTSSSQTPGAYRVPLNFDVVAPGT